jgi:hypothetical protein
VVFVAVQQLFPFAWICCTTIACGTSDWTLLPLQVSGGCAIGCARVGLRDEGGSEMRS